MKKYLLRKEFWKAFLTVAHYKACNCEKWQYAWWQARLNLIKRGEI